MLSKQGIVLGSLLLIGCLLAGCSGRQADILSTRGKHYQYSELGRPLSQDASKNCAEAGGIPALTKQLNGHQVPVCQLANGRRCNEQALLDGGCSSI
ncbi:conserved exported protein of unknown function [Xenorhabdus poinarii G6]|uniref:Lipoprotein n=1 Tax=Xenorhabdus poinarii G6 TaxID=1354304 RepID=A0A068R5B1_9GAMM|nr:DUF333 domain-containing protein [Xenorhabdus poinarii]CDG21270.1 conserved exported protein of unknown function [Xenorhabdus poinarii G6]